MKKYLSAFLCLTMFALFISCNKPYKYASDPSISNNNGSRIDSLDISFIKDTITFEGKQYTNQWDLLTKNKLDSTLSETGAPILYNYYLDRDIIRIVKLNKDSTTIIDMSNDNDKSWLSYKLITTKNKDSVLDSIDTVYTDVNILTINLDQEQWNTIDSLAQNVVFDQMENLERVNKKSDKSYFIEYHTDEKYFYIFTDEKDKTLKELLKTVNSKHNRVKI